MNLLPLLLTSGGAVAVLGSWALYMGSVPSGRVPPRPVGHLIVQAVGMVSALTGLAQVAASPTLPIGLPSAALAGLALTMGGLFFFLLTQRKTPLGKLRVAVGDPMLPFSAATRDGVAFHSDQLRGQRVLFKFFRGHW